MPFKFRKGFTLAELVIATLIFGFMIISLALIYSSANNHLFHNYRMNTFKSNASIAMKTITSKLQEANRIDAPGFDASGAILAFAVNVDQLSGCYPVNPAEPVRWHYFCHSSAVTSECPSGSCLYYHTDTIVVPSGNNCPSGPSVWTTTDYPVLACGGAYGTVTLLSSDIFPKTAPELFSRRSIDGIAGSALVNISLRVRWDPVTNNTTGRDFRTTDKLIDTTLNTTVRVNRAGLSGSGF